MSDRGRTCLLCSHFHIEPGAIHWSEVTPGSDSDIRCLKDHWAYCVEFTTDQYREAMLTAVKCDDYVYYKSLEGK